MSYCKIRLTTAIALAGVFAFNASALQVGRTAIVLGPVSDIAIAPVLDLAL